MKKRKILIFSILMLCTKTIASAQDNTEYSKEFYGFIRTDFFGQTADMVNSVDELFTLYPKPVNINDEGEDLTRIPSAGLHSIATRMGVHFHMPGILGAQKGYGRIEADFSGGSDYVWVRLRQAYVKLNWERGEWLLGQTWHPLFTESIMPNVININTGAPYIAFNRSPQLKYTYSTDYGKVYAAAIYQTMYKSPGPDGSVIRYKQDGVLPNLFLGYEYTDENWIGGLGFDYKPLRPERYFVNSIGDKYLNNRVLNSYSGVIYGAYKEEGLIIAAKAIYGQNLGDHSIIGGYAIHDSHTEYIPFNSFSSLVNVSYGQLHKLNLFAGYSANLGSAWKIDNQVTYYGFGSYENQHIRDMYRIALSYTYNPSHWRIGPELEYDNAAWGSLDKGQIVSCQRNDVLRLTATVMYLF